LGGLSPAGPQLLWPESAFLFCFCPAPSTCHRPGAAPLRPAPRGTFLVPRGPVSFCHEHPRFPLCEPAGTSIFPPNKILFFCVFPPKVIALPAGTWRPSPVVGFLSYTDVVPPFPTRRHPAHAGVPFCGAGRVSVNLPSSFFGAHWYVYSALFEAFQQVSPFCVPLGISRDSILLLVAISFLHKQAFGSLTGHCCACSFPFRPEDSCFLHSLFISLSGTGIFRR